MKKLGLLLLVVVLGAVTANAQVAHAPSLPGECQAFKPKVLVEARVLTENDVNTLLNTSYNYGQNAADAPRGNKKFWIAYSDRSNNTTYTTQEGNVVCGKLEWNEKVYIAKIYKGWALVYNEPMENIAYPRISQYAECKGWISMENLLLWDSALANSNKIYQKALLCVNSDEKSSASVGKLYYNPKNKNDYEVVKSDMNFYFVMKHEGDLSLLATSYSMDGNSDMVLKGWLSKNSYVAWNQRSCIEPTWDAKDVEYFADEGIWAYYYDSPSCVNDVTHTTFVRKEQPPKRDKYLYRMPKDQLRFPILDGGTTELYHCSTFGTLEGGASQINSTTSSGVSVASVVEHVTQEMENINIGIVIDGTTSMGKFYPAVKEAINQAKDIFNDDKYKVKVGIVIYRDHADGQYVTEVAQLTPIKNSKIMQFLEKGGYGNYGIKSSRADITYEEALYKGIDTAIEKLNFDKDQSNILLVVGDCGNDAKDTAIKPENLVNKLVDKNINLVGFQVYYGEKEAYALFNSQVQDLLKKSLNKRYQISRSDNAPSKLKMQETEEGYTLKNVDGATLYIGSYYYPSYGQEMPTSKLTELIETSIIQLSEAVQKQIGIMNKVANQGLDGLAKFDEEWARNKLGEEAYEQVKKQELMMTFKGYALKKKNARSLFKPVVFITSDELTTLIEDLSPVYNAASSIYASDNPDREPYVNAMKSLVKAMIPDDFKRADKMTVDEIMQKVAGLNESADALKKYSLSDLGSPAVVSTQDFQTLVRNFVDKYRRLQNLKGQDYPYSKVMNGVKYYWLPLEDLP